MIFDHIISSPSGYFLGMKTKPQTSEMAMAMTPKITKIDINKLHCMLGHANEAYSRLTAKEYGWEATGKWAVCENCAIAKSKQKKLSKTNTSPVMYPGEQLYLDTSSIKSTAIDGIKFWCLLVDEVSKMKWSFFLKKKSDQINKLLPFLKDMKTQKALKYICCDNAGKNTSLDSACKTEALGLTFEFTSPGTPQHNGVVERSFATLYGRVRSMMNAAKLTEERRKMLWAECANTATDIDNIVVAKETTPYRAFYGKDPKYLNHLRIFGELGVIKDHSSSIKSKLKDKGFKVMFLGYAKEHSGEVF